MTKILVIEDATPLRNDIVEMLSFEGFEVMGAENGVVGVNMARDHHPDLIICDIMMPELDGYGVLDVLRQDEETFSIPFIFLTAKTDRADIRHGMGLGADDYLTKPFVADELLSTIRARLEKQDKHKEVMTDKLRELSENIITALPHELRTPLNTIVGFSEMLMSESERLSPEQVDEWAGYINQAAQRLYRLVENYLAYVRAEVAARNAEEAATFKARVLGSPTAIIEYQVLHRAQQMSRQNDLEVVLAADVKIVASEQDLSKIIDELVDNALKFSEPGQSVKVTSAVVGDYYEVRICDEGRGMTAAQAVAIGAYVQFERWLYEQQGSGLGLAIVKRLIDLYGGEIEVESEVSQGTCIKLRFLLAQD